MGNIERMADERRPFWEAAYRSPDAKTFGPPSEEVVRLATTLPAGARALDLGCGDGRNAICLAEHGLIVDAVDRSEAGVRKLRARAEQAGLAVRARIQDLATFTFRRRYDLVIAHGVLHMLPREVWEPTIEAMKRHTVAGGRNVVAVFTDRLPPPPDLVPYMGDLFREGQLRDRYRDWTVELWKAYTLDDEHPGGVRHRHPINKIVARRL